MRDHNTTRTIEERHPHSARFQFVEPFEPSHFAALLFISRRTIITYKSEQGEHLFSFTRVALCQIIKCNVKVRPGSDQSEDSKPAAPELFFRCYQWVFSASC